MAGAVGFNGAAADVPDEKLRLRCECRVGAVAPDERCGHRRAPGWRGGGSAGEQGVRQIG